MSARRSLVFVALAGDVIRALRGSVKREMKYASDRIMMTALDFGGNIAEGTNLPTPRHCRR
jgi:hypothetical protein